MFTFHLMHPCKNKFDEPGVFEAIKMIGRKACSLMQIDNKISVHFAFGVDFLSSANQSSLALVYIVIY